MASTDARPVPQKNVAYRVTLPILDADGDLVTGAAGLDSEISKDGGTFADCTNEATEIATSSGVYYLDLTSTEMNADCVAIIVKTSTVGAKTTVIVLYPEEAGDIRVNVTQWAGTTAVLAGSLPSVSALVTAINNATITNSTFGAGAIDATAIASNAITAAKIAADAITAAKIADGAIDAATFAAGAVDATAFAQGAADKVWSTTVRTITGGTIGTYTGNIPQTGDSFARIGAAGAGLTAIPWNASWDAEVQSEADDALRALFLHQLLAADYDPAAKPGVATALLNELVGNDGGVSQFTANTLELAPTGGSAPTTAQIATAVWQDLMAGADFGTAASVGKLLKDNINAPMSGLAPASTALSTDTWTNGRAINLDNLNATITSRMATFTLPTNFSALGINASGHLSRVVLVDTVTAITGLTIGNVENAAARFLGMIELDSGLYRYTIAALANAPAGGGGGGSLTAGQDAKLTAIHTIVQAGR